jgi:hypothetical protein
VGSVWLTLAPGKEIRLGWPMASRVGIVVEECKKTGAGYAMYRQEKEVVYGKIGLGEKSNNYNGELCALAGATQRAGDA